jgi:hypothetical protein
MAAWETRPVTVTLTVQVDGHELVFTESGKASGAFYHGEKPPHDYNEIMEKAIRGTVDTLTERVSRKSAGFIARAYPVHPGSNDA